MMHEVLPVAARAVQALLALHQNLPQLRNLREEKGSHGDEHTFDSRRDKPSAKHGKVPSVAPHGALVVHGERQMHQVPEPSQLLPVQGQTSSKLQPCCISVIGLQLWASPAVRIEG